MQNYRPISVNVTDHVTGKTVTVYFDTWCKASTCKLLKKYLQVVTATTIKDYFYYSFNIGNTFIFKFNFEKCEQSFIYTFKVKLAITEEGFYQFTSNFNETLEVSNSSSKCILFDRDSALLIVPSVINSNIFSIPDVNTTIKLGDWSKSRLTLQLLQTASNSYFNKQLLEVSKDILNWFNFLKELN